MQYRGNIKVKNPIPKIFLTSYTFNRDGIDDLLAFLYWAQVIPYKNTEEFITVFSTENYNIETLTEETIFQKTVKYLKEGKFDNYVENILLKLVVNGEIIVNERGEQI